MCRRYCTSMYPSRYSTVVVVVVVVDVVSVWPLHITTDVRGKCHSFIRADRSNIEAKFVTCVLVIYFCYFIVFVYCIAYFKSMGFFCKSASLRK